MIVRLLPAAVAGCLLLLLTQLTPATSPSHQYLLASPSGPEPGTLPPGWSTVDHNGDGMTWEVSDWGGLRGNPTNRLRVLPMNGSDDELLSMPFLMQAGQEAVLTFHLRYGELGAMGSSLTCRLVPTGDPDTAPPPVEVGVVAPIPPGAFQYFEFPFVAPETGEYRFAFHAEVPVDSTNNTLGAVYLDRIRVRAPEENLEVVLQLDAGFHGSGPPAYPPDDPIRALVFVRNNGPEAVEMNSRMALDDLNHPDGVLGFDITTPDGTVLPFEAHVRRAIPSEADFVRVNSGEMIFKFQDINQGFFALSEPGDYTIVARYRNLHKSSPRAATWMGELHSEPLTFSITPGGDAQ